MDRRAAALAGGTSRPRERRRCARRHRCRGGGVVTLRRLARGRRVLRPARRAPRRPTGRAGAPGRSAGARSPVGAPVAGPGRGPGVADAVRVRIARGRCRRVRGHLLRDRHRAGRARARGGGGDAAPGVLRPSTPRAHAGAARCVARRTPRHRRVAGRRPFGRARARHAGRDRSATPPRRLQPLPDTRRGCSGRSRHSRS